MQITIFCMVLHGFVFRTMHFVRVTHVYLSTIWVWTCYVQEGSKTRHCLVCAVGQFRAVPQALHPPSKYLARTFNSTTRLPVRDNTSLNPLSSPAIALFWFLITDQQFFNREELSLMRFKIFGPQKRPLLPLFSRPARIAAILDVAMLCAVGDARCKTRELP